VSASVQDHIAAMLTTELKNIRNPGLRIHPHQGLGNSLLHGIVQHGVIVEVHPGDAGPEQGSDRDIQVRDGVLISGVNGGERGRCNLAVRAMALANLKYKY
jgi:hypothetical protein